MIVNTGVMFRELEGREVPGFLFMSRHTIGSTIGVAISVVTN